MLYFEEKSHSSVELVCISVSVLLQEELYKTINFISCLSSDDGIWELIETKFLKVC